jgi:hypothetical protein
MCALRRASDAEVREAAFNGDETNLDVVETVHDVVDPFIQIVDPLIDAIHGTPKPSTARPFIHAAIKIVSTMGSATWTT